MTTNILLFPFLAWTNTIQFEISIIIFYYVSYTQERLIMGKVRNVMFRGWVVNVVTEHSVDDRTVSSPRNDWIVVEFQTNLFVHEWYEFKSACEVQINILIANENDMYLVITSAFYNIYNICYLWIIGHKIQFKEIPRFKTVRSGCDVHRNEQFSFTVNLRFYGANISYTVMCDS